jgi:hypothetical protein
MRFYRLALVVVLLLGSVPACRAAVIIDPSSATISSFGLNMVFFAPMGQSFTADVSDISWIGMFISTCNCSGLGSEFQLNLLNGAGTGGTLVASETLVAPGGAGFIYFDFRGTSLVVGNAYTATISEITPPPPHKVFLEFSGQQTYTQVGWPFGRTLYQAVLPNRT